ncbi:MAG: amino acid ABC transporter substrate-binding protein [Candidatus Promineifilaceae bacterium]|nr:amino acid ABC transporter substrate-binding protein [Candidatus Promineifilaceae bacterium]
MKRNFYLIVLLALVMALVVSGCAPAAEEAAEEAAAEVSGEQTALIGFTASQTGKYNVESTSQINGLNLCMQEVNDSGGVTLDDGSQATFASVFYDDESNTERVQELYTRLATEDDANFLISPYSSGLTDAASVIAEQYGKVMITTGAASDSTYQKGFTRVFQTYTPASRYLTGALDMLAANDPDAEDIAIVYENSKFSTDVATALQEYAEEHGFNVVLFEGYDPETTDFAPFINKIQDSDPDAILGGGHFQDGTTFVRQLDEKNANIPFVALLVAPPDPSFAELGEPAVGIVGPSQWEPQADFDAEAAEAAGLPFFGPSSSEFAEMYVEAYGDEPSYHAAGGYVACLLLQKAIEAAGSTDADAVKEALDNMDLMTFFGHMKFDTSAESHGLQIGHSMVYVQWQENGETMVKEVVWPQEGATAPTLYPAP